ncbi:hypothetical protein DYB32_001635 [Aphanomyces invadans]|uniref:Uncharacterized protein n=1 Tax=Aphanomyces invadans TaxID=157072 RepID=A0A3R6ZV45_9STRA|nr:hypothetical protein DYB32_001635 [Aphanomyces invadans]
MLLQVKDKVQFAFILLRTLDKRKAMKHEDFRGVRSLYDDKISLLLDWTKQSAPYLHVDSREQSLVQLLLHIVTKHPPSKQATKEHVAATLREVQSQAKAEATSTTQRVTADGTDELQEILQHVAFRRKETKNYSVYITIFRANGGTFCQKKTQLECAQTILKRIQADGFNWRHKLVLNFDKGYDSINVPDTT